MTREEAEILVGTLIACVNEAHAAVSAGWRDACWNAVDAAEKRVVLALVGVQPAPSVPTESIGKLLTQAMDVAVANGANSVSMPDELVEVAAWLSGVQPAPSVPDRITPEQAPESVRDYCQEAAEGYADGWNDCIKAIIAAAPKPEENK